MAVEQKIRVRKYDGRTQNFNREKIEVAIMKAAEAVGEEVPKATIKRIAAEVEEMVNSFDKKIVKVEDISKLVENKLMNSNFKDTARCYIEYRFARERERLYNTRLLKAFKMKLDGLNIENQNANLDENSFSGRMNEAARVMMKDDALNSMSKMARDNHNNNMIYVHDLDSYSSGQHNCLSIPFDSLLEKGFSTRQADVRSPRGVLTALQLVAVGMQLQSLQQFGGVSATHIDWTMVPYVRYSFAKHYRDGMKYISRKPWTKPSDKIISSTSILNKELYSDEAAYEYAYDMTQKDVHQGAEALVHNLNTLQSRSGQQLPFSSINYGTCTLEEGRMVTNALLDASLEGVGDKHKTPIFPCGIFQYQKGVNNKPGTPNYDLFKKALLSTSKRLYPNYANVDWTIDVNARLTDRKNKQLIIDRLSDENYQKVVEWVENNPEDAYELGLDLKEDNKSKKIIVLEEARPQEIFSTMGCRTSNGLDINFSEFEEHIKEILKDGKISEVEHFSAAQKDGRGNICPVTIILPTLAMEADRDVEKFMALLDKKIYEAKDMLIERYKHVCEQSPASATFMYGNKTMLGFKPEEGVESAVKHGTVVIGQLGLAETLQLLLGCDHTTELGMELAKRIEELFNKRCAEFKQEYKLNFGVYYTPAENLCYTALKKFREKYGVIENVSDKDFFTNSMHVPVWHDMTPFEKMDIESQLTGYSNAGCITYVELDSSASNNIEAMEELVNYAMEKDIPYFAINVPVDSCEICGYQGDINDECPVCGAKEVDGYPSPFKKLRRVTGYLTNSYKTAFNLGKQDEVEHRVKHTGVINVCDTKE